MARTTTPDPEASGCKQKIVNTSKSAYRDFFSTRSRRRQFMSHNQLIFELWSTATPPTMQTVARCGDNVLCDIQGGTVVRSYVTPFLDQNVSMTDHTGATAVTYWYNQDERQSVMNLTDDTGAVAQSYGHTAYGDKIDTLTDGDVEQRYTYTGRELSAVSEDYYFRYRWYGAGVGGFMTRDPLGYVDGTSVYNGWFAGGMMNDPAGLKWKYGDWHHHYVVFDGRPIDLADIGLLDQYRAGIKDQIDEVKRRVHDAAVEELRKEADCEDGHGGGTILKFGNGSTTIMASDSKYPTDVFFVLRNSNVTYSYTSTLAYKCACCPKTGEIIFSEFAVLTKFSFSLRDSYSNPTDVGGMFNAPNAKLIQEIEDCWDIKKACDKRAGLGRGSLKKRIKCANEYGACLRNAHKKYPKDKSADRVGTPYRIRATWEEDPLASVEFGTCY